MFSNEHIDILVLADQQNVKFFESSRTVDGIKWTYQEQ